MRDHTRRRLERCFLRRTELWSSKNGGIMTHPKLLYYSLWGPRKCTQEEKQLNHLLSYSKWL